VVGAGKVVSVLRSAADRGIRAAIVIAAGFAEAGEEGAALSQPSGAGPVAGPDDPRSQYRGHGQHRGRGREPANLDRVAEVVIDVVAAAAGLGPRLHSIEVNPLLADGDQAAVLDALILTRGG
jgi:hypothetical protein